MAAYVTGLDIISDIVYWIKTETVDETERMEKEFKNVKLDKVTSWAVEPSFKNEHFVSYYPDSETIHEFRNI